MGLAEEDQEETCSNGGANDAGHVGTHGVHQQEVGTVILRTTVLEKLRALAEQDDRPLSSYINLVLREHLEKLENK